jgi:ribosome recycling factor
MFEEVIRRAESKMAKAMEHTRKELATIRTGRASAALLEGIRVNYYDTSTPLNQIAGISVPEPKLLVVQPFDKTISEEIVKSIQRADLGLNPSSDGNVIRIPVPALNEERRRELSKVAAKQTEDGKVAVRQVRREANEELKKLEKAGDIPEDASRRAQTDVQKLTDEQIKRLDELLDRKRQEIMDV